MKTPKGEGCAACRFAGEVLKNGSGLRECRINPPAVNLGENKMRGLFPLVIDDDWCNAFAHIPTEAQVALVAPLMIETRPPIFEAVVIEAEPVAVGRN